MSGDGWEDEFGEDDDRTKADAPPPGLRDAVPLPVPSTEITGKYPTLPGYEVARETTERIATIRGRTTERTFLLAALRFFLIDRKSHPDAADALVAELHDWVMQPGNRRLVEAVLGWDKNPP